MRNGSKSQPTIVKRKGPLRRKPAPLALEPRLMFDGAALVTATTATAEPTPTPTQTDAPSHATEPAVVATEISPERSVATLTATTPREIAFIDTTVTNWQTLAQDVRAGVEIILLDGTKDGLAQIANVLAERHDLAAIHIISHGADGALMLGGQSYTADNLSAHSAELTTIGQALAPNGDVLLYGCDIAHGSAGERFIQEIAHATQADVAASSNLTGASSAGGDWTLEVHSGDVTAMSFAEAASLTNYNDTLTSISLTGNTGWVPVMIGTNFDPQGDSQAGAADTDLVGDATHAAMYVAFDNGGTTGTSSDDYMLFRIRVDNPTSSTNFGGVAIVGIDANLDGRIDLFFAVDGRNNSQRVQLFDPGTGLNNSPSSTTTSPLPTGWLPNNGIYPFSASNYSVIAVSGSTDPNWNGDNDLGNDGKTDVFVSFKVPLSDIATVLAIPSPTDRNGVVGPRGTTGITGFDADTVVRYVLMSQTQPGPINGDLGGVGASYDKNATFDQLGSFTAPMSPANPIAAGATLTVIEPIGDGNLSASEDNSVTISGSSVNLADGTSLTITISDGDGTTADISTTTTVSGNAWSVSGLDLSSLADGTLTVTAETTSGTTVMDSATVAHDTTPPVLGITNGTSASDTTPTITGTSDLPAGTVITITVDPDNNSSTLNNLIYTTTVLSGGGWALDTGVVTPTSGTFPTTGLPPYSKITVSATDAAGNTATTTALNRPTVNSLTTNDTTPTLSGTWTNLAGDTLTVTVNGTTYTTSSGLSVSGNTWSLTTNTLSLGTYDVTATVSRSGGGTVSDAASGELVIASGPAVTITGGASASDADTTPVIAGTTTLSAGDYVLVRIDPNNDGNLSDAVTYAVTVGSGGSWSIDTGSATPISGSLPTSGISSTAGIHVTATDSNGNAATADQALTITVPTITTTSIETSLSSNSGATVIAGDAILNSREDDSVTVSGTSTNAVGSTVTVSVTDGTTTVSGTGTVAVGGAWSATGLNVSSLKDGNLTVSATVLTASDSDIVVHDKTAPVSYITTASSIDKTNPVLKGITDLPSGSTLTITVTKTSDGSAVASGTTTVGTDGRWTWQNATNVIYPTGSNAVTITVTSTATDLAGNKVAAATKAQTVANNITPPSIVVTAMTGIDYTTGDSTITSAEINSGVTISGTSSTTTGTVSVSVTDGTTTVSATPSTNGNWTMSLTKAQVQAFVNGTLTVTATVVSGGITATSMYVPKLLLVTGTPTITVSEPIDNGILNDAEDNAVTISGTSTNAVGSTVTLTVSDSDGTTANVTGTATVQNDGTWTVTGLNLSGLVDGSLTASASVTANSLTATDTANVTHDKTAPTIAVTNGASATDTTPVISGTTDLPAGSTLTITIDPNNDGVLTDQVVYTVTAQSGGTWSVNTETATPTSGTLGVSGLTAYAKISVTGSDQAGNSTTAIALNKPTVNALTTNDTTPSLSGTWTNLGTDTLTVTVNGTTYTTSSGLSVSGNTWALTTNALSAGTYNVTATATRSSTSVNDATSSELVIDTTAPAVAITSSTTTADTTPVISGTTDLPDGTVLTITIDPDNDNATNNAFTYSVIVTGGTWSVNTGTALTTSGTFPASGLAGTVGVTASGTDIAGNTSTATQTLTVDNVPPVIGFTTNASTRDTTPIISGTSDLAPGATLTLQIDPDNDGDYSNAYSYTLTVGTGGTWSVDTGAVNPDGLGSTVTLSGTVGLKASGSDSVGNSTSTTKSLTIDTSAPALTVSAVGDGNISATEDDTVLIQGTTTDIANGSTITVTITDGTHTILDTTTVSSNAWALSAINLSSLDDGLISVTASYTDGNGDAFIATGSFSHDKTPPTVVLSAASSSITGATTVTATFDETVSGLTAGDFATSNGAVVSNLVQSNSTTWTFTLTPAVNGTTSVWLPATTVQDAAGNDNAISSALSFSVNVGVPDTVAPTITSIVRQTPSDTLTNADSLTFRVTFSESMLNVDSADFALSGAAAGGASVQSVTAVSGQPGVYDVVITGIASANGSLNLALAASPTVTDAAANALTNTTPSVTEGYTLDNIAPALTTLNGAVVSYSSLVLSYDEDLSNIIPAAGDFTVTKNGSTPVTVTGIAVNTVANTITLTLDSAVSYSDSVTVSYTAGTNRTQDLAGNIAANLTNRAVTNSTPAPDTTAPAAPSIALLSSSDSGQSNSDRTTSDDTPTIRVTLNGTGATAPVGGDVVKLYVGGSVVGTATLSASDITAGYVDITTNALGADGALSVTAKITDAATNESNASNTLALTLDTTAPALTSAVVNGSTLTLTYDESLGSASPAAGDFSVVVNGSGVTPSGVVVNTSAKTVTLTLPGAVNIGDTVSVSYTPGTNQTQDPAGNLALALSSEPVTNTTGDTTPPTLTSFDDGDADNSVAVGDVLTYTVTFSEDIDSSTVSAADFSNSGTAGISIGTITETSPGAFSVDITTTSPGSLILQINAGAVIKDAAGNNLNTTSAIVDSTTVTVSDVTAPAAPGIALLASSDSGGSNSDRVTNDDTPTIRVSLNGSGATAPVAGDVVTLYLGATSVGIATLSAGDITNDYVDITTSSLGADGVKTLTAKVTDAANNVSSASPSLLISLDTAVPTLASASVDGASLVLTYNETLGSTAPATGDFSVSVNGSAVTPSGVVVDTTAKTVTLSLPSAVTNSDSVSITYVAAANKIQDVAGNVAADLSAQAVANSTADTTAPAAPSIALLASSDSGQSNSDRNTNDNTPTVRVTLNGTGATAPVAGDIVNIYLGGTTLVGSATLGAGDISNGYVDVTTSTLGADGAKSLTATVTDAANNVSGASSALALALDTTVPTLSTATITGNTLVLTYGETLGTATPSASDFSVSINGSTVTPSAVAIDTAAKTVTLTLPGAANNGDVVTVTYVGATNATQDVAGNTAANLSAQAVNNLSTDSTAPTLATFDDGDADNSVTVGDVLMYTVTFSEDIDSTSVSAADFGNGGTAGISIGAISEISPGVFSVQVTTTSTGTLVLQVNAGAVIQDVAGNSLNTASAIIDGTIVTVNASAQPTPPTPSPSEPPARPVPEVIVSAPMPLPAAPTVNVMSAITASTDVASTAPGFNSFLGLSSTLDTAQPSRGIDATRANETARSFGGRGKLLENVLTSTGENAFRIVVASTDEPNLLVFHGIPDQAFAPEKALEFKIPTDAFLHTNAKAVVRLRATLMDGRALPAWLHFDAASGKFDGKPPHGRTEVLSILVTARDGEGREAATIFRIRFDKGTTIREHGRASLSEQLRSAANRPAAKPLDGPVPGRVAARK